LIVVKQNLCGTIDVLGILSNISESEYLE